MPAETIIVIAVVLAGFAAFMSVLATVAHRTERGRAEPGKA